MTVNQGLSPTEVEALFTETFTTHSSTTPAQVTNTIEQMFDSLVPYFTEVTHPQKRTRHPKVLTFTTDHKQMWAYLRSQQSEIAGCVMFDLSCAARDLGMTQKRVITVIGDLENAGWIICRDIGNPGTGTYQITIQDIETIVSLCSSITYAQPTTLTMDALRGARLLH
ncbi:hypothetical protein I5462_04290 [Citrobacter freundii]|uniref:hypothetical protein n=1 Tax=Citrobacter TaxID=544 RepID=UPI0009A1F6C7|nr:MULTISPECIES: hypothetical protein [Citrobacter]EKW2050864.1 hypothetical protein [Citrobacter freundii]EMB4338370.1 hypothetical protein [Citrobacter freundii]MBJ8788233.1 hypothetical protein [Citrobacter freundii]MBJ9040304.1 hypothetical protein [Citrobacter freundii]MDH1756588.1 hypothetical protein [Citrobacter braakii]